MNNFLKNFQFLGSTASLTSHTATITTTATTAIITSKTKKAAAAARNAHPHVHLDKINVALDVVGNKRKSRNIAGVRVGSVSWACMKNTLLTVMSC